MNAVDPKEMTHHTIKSSLLNSRAGSSPLSGSGLSDIEAFLTGGRERMLATARRIANQSRSEYVLKRAEMAQRHHDEMQALEEQYGAQEERMLGILCKLEELGR